MITNKLREFVDVVMEVGQITDADVSRLAREVLGEAIMSHDVIDVLVALDRAVKVPNTNWADFLTATTVDYAVWTSRPTGMVDAELARWLITTLSISDGPTDTGMRIAFEVVREAERCDEILITFAMGKAGLRARQDFSRCDTVLLVA